MGMGAWSDGLEQHCLEPVLYVIYTYNLSEEAIRLIGFILADARFFYTHNNMIQYEKSISCRGLQKVRCVFLHLNPFKIKKKLYHPLANI